MTSIYKKIYLSIGLGALVFLGFSVYLDDDRLLGALARFDWIVVPLALGLALTNYGLRFCRWEGYLNRLSIEVERTDSLRVFLSGLVLSVTPGKAGELMKAVLIHERTGTPVGTTSSVVFAERLTDFVGLTLLSLIGILSFREGALTLAVAMAGSVALLLLVFWPGALKSLIGVISRLPAFGRLAEPLAQAHEGARLLLSPAAFVQALGLAVAAWFAECVGLYVILLGFGYDIGVVSSTFIYSFATIFGAVTFLPGGLGTTEASMTALLGLHGVGLEGAVAATFLIRTCTLWFAVFLGGLVLVRSGFADECRAATPPQADDAATKAPRPVQLTTDESQ